jgi:hypothetical protein
VKIEIQNRVLTAVAFIPVVPRWNFQHYSDYIVARKVCLLLISQLRLRREIREQKK